jgi:hypothetical protein
MADAGILASDASTSGVALADAATPGDAGAGCSEENPCYSVAVCMGNYSSASADSCDTSLMCTQDVEIDGVVEQRSAQVNLACYSANGTRYQCSCSMGSTSVTLTTMSNDAWDACTMAIPSCAARLQL